MERNIENKEKLQVMAVVGLIRDDTGKILLQKRVDPNVPDAHEKWEFPGGKIDFGESPQEALVRECREEIGCTVRAKRLLPVVQSKIWTKKNGKRYHVLVFCFEAHITAGKPRPCDKQVSEVRWFEKENVSKLNTLRGIEELIGLLE